MNGTKADQAILRFFRDDIGGILITDETGNVLYGDEQTAFIRQGRSNWNTACPSPQPGQKKEVWDLLNTDTGESYMVTTSTYEDEEGTRQIHYLADTSLYTALFRGITDYSRILKTEKDHDGLTGLYNKGKFMEMKQTVFRTQETIAVFNMDINNLKHVNDAYGHEAGDRLIRKAAESLKRIETRNVVPFRVGGDEFVVIAFHVNREEAEKIRRKWEETLAALNRSDNGPDCVVACGFAFGEKGFDVDEILATADRLMYEDKSAKKRLNA